jgi:hypothetical protein
VTPPRIIEEELAFITAVYIAAVYIAVGFTVEAIIVGV